MYIFYLNIYLLEVLEIDRPLITKWTLLHYVRIHLFRQSIRRFIFHFSLNLFIYGTPCMLTHRLIYCNKYEFYRTFPLFYLPGINCRKRWKNLKDQCRKEMRKNPNESDWPHFQKLKFIHNQFLADDEECDEDTVDEVFDSLDESIKRPKLGQ